MLSGTPGVGWESSEAKLAQKDMLAWALFNRLKRIKSFLALCLITKQVHAFILKRKFKQYPRVYNKAWKFSFLLTAPDLQVSYWVWCAWFGGGECWSGVRMSGTRLNLCHRLAVRLWTQASVCSPAKWRDHDKGLGACVMRWNRKQSVKPCT